MAKRRMMVDREVQSRAAKGGNAGVVRRLEEAGPKHLVKTSIVDRDVVYEDMKKVPTVVTCNQRIVFTWFERDQNKCLG